jgi:cytochrome c
MRPSVTTGAGLPARLRRLAFVAAALASMPLTAFADGDPAAGKAVFKASCNICHSPFPSKIVIGPPLFGVVGRPSTSVPGYNYSSANAASHLVWTQEPQEQLDKYIEAPQKIVPGTKMMFPGLPDAAKRADLVAYLSTLK